MPEIIDRRSYIDRVAAWFGIGDLDLRVTPNDRRRLMLASIAPALVLLGDVAFFLVQWLKSIPYYDYSPTGSEGLFDLHFGLWWHLYVFIRGVEVFLLPVSLALLVLFSVYHVNRRQASLALVIAVVLLNVAIIAGAFSVIPSLFENINNTSPSGIDHYTPIASETARDAGVLAIGFAFLAYRGLAVRTLPPASRRLRKRPQQQTSG